MCLGFLTLVVPPGPELHILHLSKLSESILQIFLGDRVAQPADVQPPHRSVSTVTLSLYRQHAPGSAIHLPTHSSTLMVSVGLLAPLLRNSFYITCGNHHPLCLVSLYVQVFTLLNTYIFHILIISMSEFVIGDFCCTSFFFPFSSMLIMTVIYQITKANSLLCEPYFLDFGTKRGQLKSSC